MSKNATDPLEYSTFGKAIRGLCRNWCETHRYTDPFLKDGEWWAFPPGGVMPVQVKTVMGEASQRTVRIGPLRVTLFPDGSLA